MAHDDQSHTDEDKEPQSLAASPASLRVSHRYEVRGAHSWFDHGNGGGAGSSETVFYDLPDNSVMFSTVENPGRKISEKISNSVIFTSAFTKPRSMALARIRG